MMEKVLAVVAGVAHLAKHRHIICLILPPSHPSGLKSINLFFRIKDISTSQIEIWTNGKPWKPDENPRVQISLRILSTPRIIYWAESTA